MSKPKPKETEPHQDDVYAGSRVRAQRKAMGFSQQELAEKIGLTFQQVQKYEHGTNRISVSRLGMIAKVLEVEVSFFFLNPGKAGRIQALPIDLSDTFIVNIATAAGKIPKGKKRTIALDFLKELAKID